MSNLQADSREAFERLISEQSSYIGEVDEQIAKWTQFQSDYQQLRARLSTLPDRLTYDCTVPFGKLAFIPGRVIHSNEILVLLGDNYFAERSCKQAIEIVDRRLTNIEENLRKHEKEKEVFHQQKRYTHDFLDDKTKFIEIKETDEEIKPVKSAVNRRAKLTEEQIREERRRLQERALKLSEKPAKKVHFDDDDQMEVDSDDDDDHDNEIPSEQFKKIFIRHTKTTTEPVGDTSPGLFSHPGAIGRKSPMAFTGRTIEREVSTPNNEPPPKRISKFRASRQ
ncbi:unnamed protein product [Adineta ricciae]|uniref:Uncharacterized protein n=1 Tax=Adineta ricciae TaxID=249248 RepID=A0A813ZB36_ADIRI|nr:unnamed protein product [Adineta ricciae]CAF1054751.1 unnamed protein product [Adineta ricciae]